MPVGIGNCKMILRPAWVHPPLVALDGMWSGVGLVQTTTAFMQAFKAVRDPLRLVYNDLVFLKVVTAGQDAAARLAGKGKTPKYLMGTP